MRTMVRVTIPVEAGNAAIKDGSLPKILAESMDKLRPEAAYFLTDGQGRRHMMLVIDLQSPADVPRVAEPFFMGLNAGVELSPCMNADDLRKGLSSSS